MSILIQLRRHIKSIQTTKKITYAMRLISISLYAKVEKHNAPLTHYRQTVASLTGNLAKIMPDWHHDQLFPQDILDTKPLIILVASSKGLCGGFNSNLMRYFKRSSFIEEHQQATFITVGQKATNYIEQQNIGPIALSYNDFSSNNVSSIADDIIAYLAEHTHSSITLYSNYFKNFFMQPPHKTVITPVDRKALQEDGKSSSSLATEDSDLMIWEQDPSTIGNKIALLYMRSCLLHGLYQSLIAEQAARFIAMDAATSNAEKMLEGLTLEYNKSRQALITKELSELSASSL